MAATLNQLPSIFLLLLLVVTLVDITAADQVLQQQLTRADQQLGALTTRVIALSHRLEETAKDVVEAGYSVRRLARQLDAQEGMTGACRRGFFPCGPGPSGAVQCVKDYLVCDGSEDCKSGDDESPEICQNMPFAEPVTFPLHVYEDTCRAAGGSKPHQQRSTNNVIMTSHVLPWFPSRPQLKWTYVFHIGSKATDDIDIVVTGSGHYDYATGDGFMAFQTNQAKIGRFISDPVNTEKVRFLWRLGNTVTSLDNPELICIRGFNYVNISK